MARPDNVLRQDTPTRWERALIRNPRENPSSALLALPARHADANESLASSPSQVEGSLPRLI